MRPSLTSLGPLAAALVLFACGPVPAARAADAEKNYDAAEVLLVDPATGYLGIQTVDAAGNEIKTALKADLAKTLVVTPSNEDMQFTDIAVGDIVDVQTRPLPSGAEEVLEIDLYKQPSQPA